MSADILVHKSIFQVAGRGYEVCVFSRPDGSHHARTAFADDDVIINDGLTLEEVLAKHRCLLPLAVNSREILGALRENR